MSKQAPESQLVAEAKEKAKHLHSILKSRIPDVKLGECLNFYARLNGAKDWNILTAKLERENLLQNNRFENLKKISSNIVKLELMGGDRGNSINLSDLEHIHLEIKNMNAQVVPSGSDYVSEYHIDICMRYEEGEKVKIGYATAFIVRLRNVIDAGEDVAVVLDAHSSDLESLYSVFIDDGGIMHDLSEGIGHDVMLLHELYLEKAIRGYGLGKMITVGIINELMQGGIVVLEPSPFVDDDKGRKMTETEIEVGGKKLRSYFMTLGFDELEEGSDYLFFSMASALPKPDSLLMEVEMNIKNKLKSNTIIIDLPIMSEDML